MDHRNLGDLLEEHAAMLASVEQALELIKQSLEDIRSQSVEVSKIMARLMEIRKLSLKTDLQVGKAGELITLIPVLDSMQKSKDHAA